MMLLILYFCCSFIVLFMVYDLRLSEPINFVAVGAYGALLIYILYTWDVRGETLAGDL